MSRFFNVLALVLVGAAAISSTRGDDDGDSTRLATYRNGEATAFALSVELNQVPGQLRANDIAIFVDTSASQTGVFQEDSLNAVRKLIGQLGDRDRVRIYAVDLEVVPLTDDFVSPTDTAVEDALAALAARAPLGSTDMENFATTLPSVFENRADSNCAAIYVGDGVGRGGSLSLSEQADIIWSLVRDQISVSSLAIGPERDMEFLAILANQTGGNIVIDTDDAGTVDQAARALAQTVHQPVFWPSQSSFSESVAEFLPGRFPPVRGDRDTIVIGTLKSYDDVVVEVQGTLEGRPLTTRWTATPEASDREFSFLPQLIEDSRASQGLTLPTVGSAGLREVARLMSDSAEKLTALSTKALAVGDYAGAKTLANAALAHDPSNATADALDDIADAQPEIAIEFAPTDSDQDSAAQDQAPASSEPAPAAEAASGDAIRIDGGDAGQDAAPAQDSSIDGQEQDYANQFLQTEKERYQAAVERIRAEVRSALAKASQEVNTGPDRAVSRIKDMMDIVDRDPMVDAGTRAQLNSQLQSALVSAQRRKYDVEERLAAERQRAAVAAEADRMYNEMQRKEDQIAALVNRFNSLIQERDYGAAADLSEQVLLMDFYSPEANAIETQSRIRYYLDQVWELRRQRQIGVVDALYEVELAHIPFAGNPPLRFPPPEEWARKVAARKKYQSVRLAGNVRDEAILEKLEETVDFDYEEVPFSDVIDDLRNDPGINIILDDSSDLKAETPVSFNVKGVRLKSALKLMLRQHNSTYVVKDEVLQIMSVDQAAEELVTYVYNVGDLVAPRTPIFGGGGFGGGGGGFGGQGGGGGFGGQAGGGGGFGGGQFSIDDQLEIGVKADEQNSQAPTREPERLAVERGENETSRVAWARYFSTHHADPLDVRHTVGLLMNEKDTGQVVDVIYGCIANQQTQAWMYEALILALQINGAPRSEIERAVMSSIDFSSDPNDALFAAKFMAENGMRRRALDVLRKVAQQNPLRPEPFAMGLQIGDRAGDLLATRWAVLGVLSQAWPEHREIVDSALRGAEAIAIQLKRENRTEELAEFIRQRDEALYRDCVIEVAWTGDADIDLYVEEPGGTVCSRQVSRTTGGGVLMGDRYSRPNETGQVTEHYVLPKGFAGNYRLILRRVWGSVPSNKATVTIYRNFRSPEQTGQTKQVTLKNDGAIVAFELEKGRRTESLAGEMLANLVREQEAIDPGVLAQQLAASQSAKALADYLGSKPDAPKNTEDVVLQNGAIGRRGNPGYQPIISTFPDGTGLTARAVTADRLHVIVSPSPIFQFIGDVETFTFFGSASNQGTGGTGTGGTGTGGGAGGGAAGGGAAGGIQGAGGGLF
jgi:uncharacterized membrane protein YgcG